MPDHDDTTPQESEYGGPSKSAVKRQMTALQQLGETLTHLTDKQLTQIPIEDERLRQVIAEARNIRSHSARKRHLQLIGKLMRHIDPQPIQQALEKLDQNRRQDAERFHALEQMRDQILAAGVSGTELAAQRWPQADRQQLRQLVLQHQRELQKAKPLAASRKLFRYLRELQELYGADD
jgi:ribosome-associated protein